MAAAAALVDDLMFLSRILEAARRVGTEVQGVRDVLRGAGSHSP